LDVLLKENVVVFNLLSFILFSFVSLSFSFSFSFDSSFFIFSSVASKLIKEQKLFLFFHL